MAIDAGYSAAHVHDFYTALAAAKCPLPDVTMLTHWHFDHSYGLHAIHGLGIACEVTNAHLRREQTAAEAEDYAERCRAADVYFAREYAAAQPVMVVPAAVSFRDMLSIDLGGLTACCLHVISPHSDDCVCIHVPEEKLLFLGDAVCGDYFNRNAMDLEKFCAIIDFIEETPCDVCVLSHEAPLTKAQLLMELRQELEEHRKAVNGA